MNKFLSILIILCFYKISFSQTTEDVVRIMNEDVAGTARTMGLGGAQSVLGADIGAFQYNPASIGLFRSSQAALSVATIFDKNSTVFSKQDFNNNQRYVTLNNFGLAFATTDDSNEKLKNITIGFSYHRKINFENDFTYDGLNDGNSFTTYLGEQTTAQRTQNPDALNINGIIDPIENIAQLAWKSELIKDPINDDSLFHGAAEYGGVHQEHVFDEDGYYNNWDITLGANYNDFIYFGGSLGIHYYDYGYTDRFIEKDIEDTIPNFVGFTYQDEYNIQGIGTNFKVGAIVRPIDWFRIGLSMETPTVFNLESSQKIILEDVITDDGNTFVAVAKDFELEEQREQLTLTTPVKFTLGMVFLAGKYGLLTADIEKVNYAKPIFPTDKTIQNELKNTTNIRTGIEGRYEKYRVRVGAAFNGNPYTDATLKGRNYYTFGLGYKTDIYFVDLAYVKTKLEYSKIPYDVALGIDPSADIIKSTGTFTITIGSQF